MLLPGSDILDVLHRKCSNTHYSIKGYPLSTLFTHHPAFCAEAHQPTPIAFLGKPSIKKSAVFLTLFKRGVGGLPMFKNYVGNCRVFWRSFNNMKFA